MVKFFNYGVMNEAKVQAFADELKELKSLLSKKGSIIGKLESLVQTKSDSGKGFAGSFYHSKGVEDMIAEMNELRKKVHSINKQAPKVIATLQVAVNKSTDLSKRAA